MSPEEVYTLCLNYQGSPEPKQAKTVTEEQTNDNFQFFFQMFFINTLLLRVLPELTVTIELLTYLSIPSPSPTPIPPPTCPTNTHDEDADTFKWREMEQYEFK